MVILIGGASHTGKTLLAQKLLLKYKYPYLSVDHLKMGLIRSGSTDLSPLSDDETLTKYLWPIVREIIKTAIENSQNLIVEGCYIPFDFAKDFDRAYLSNIRHIFLIMSEQYIKKNFADIIRYANIIEMRIDDSDCTEKRLNADNLKVLEMCQKQGLNYILMENEYLVNEDALFL